MRPFLLLLGLACAAAAIPARAGPATAEQIGAAYAEVVDLPGEVSLAAALVGEGEPRFFLTKAAERELLLGAPAAEVRRLDALKKARDPQALKDLAADPGPARAAAGDFRYFGAANASAPGAAALSFLVRNPRGRWIALSVVWNHESATPAALAEPVERLLRVLARAD